MAISTNFSKVKTKFNPQYWDNIDDFETFYLKQISERSEHTNYYTDRCGKERKISPVNHFPELKEYEIWMEGYSATGQHSDAIFIGKEKGRNFAQACHTIMCKRYLKNIKEENNPNYKEYITPGRWDYDPNNLTYWACKLYWSEDLARKTFG